MESGGVDDSSLQNPKKLFVNEVMTPVHPVINYDHASSETQNSETRLENTEQLHKPRLDSAEQQLSKPLGSRSAPVEFPGRHVVIETDSRLPEGWHRKIVQRQSGKSAGKYDSYIYSPSGRKFRSRLEIQRYLEEIGSDLTLDQFDFRSRGWEHAAVKARCRPVLPSLPNPVQKTTSDEMCKWNGPLADNNNNNNNSNNNNNNSSSKKKESDGVWSARVVQHGVKNSSTKGRLVVKMNFSKTQKIHRKHSKSTSQQSCSSYSETSVPVKKRKKAAVISDNTSTELDHRHKGQL